MSEKKSLATEVYETVLDEMESMYETLLEAFTPPFGQEQVSIQEFIKALPQMPIDVFAANLKRMTETQIFALIRVFDELTPEQRVELIRQKGADWLLEALQKKEPNEVRS